MNEDVKILNSIVSNVEKVIVGKRYTIELVLVSLLCEGHVLIEDIPGVGKTSLASALAKSIDCSFNRIQFTPDILPSDITGFSIYNQKNGEFEYKQGAVMSQFVLADEINRTSPKTQSSLLEVMQERQVTVDGNTYKMKSPFMVIATQNPVEYLGTFPLPEAQLDRFFMKVSIGYPHRLQEQDILLRFRDDNPLESLFPVAKGGDIVALQNKVTKVYVDQKLIEYVVDLVGATRNHSSVVLGASPRASIALLKASQAWAFYNGRDYVLPDDIKEMAEHILSHRLKLKNEAGYKNITAQKIIREIIENIPVPRV